MTQVLIVGGAGYIGSVTTQLFYESGYETTVLDNLSTGHKKNLPDGINFVEGDTKNYYLLEKIFQDNDFDFIINFAAKIRADQSIDCPKEYIDNNIFGSTNLIDLASTHNAKGFIFSSTAAVYGNPVRIPIQENDTKEPINPYGLSKYIVEQILYSYEKTHSLNWCALRYFNAAGTYRGIGPDYPFKTHVIPVATQKLMNNDVLEVFGNDYNTSDGTCIRDYVHVYDIARAHLYAIESMLNGVILNQPINLGSGHGKSILELIERLEKVASKKLEYKFASRRNGDPARLVASNNTAYNLLGWKPEKEFDQIMLDAWKWQMFSSS